MKKLVVIKTQFAATHCWPEVPPYTEENYLQYRHRHVFHIVMKWSISHNDRDIEFIGQKNIVENYLRVNFEGEHLGRTSCEDIAERLMVEFKAVYVSVFEDNENGVQISID